MNEQVHAAMVTGGLFALALFLAWKGDTPHAMMLALAATPSPQQSVASAIRSLTTTKSAEAPVVAAPEVKP